MFLNILHKRPATLEPGYPTATSDSSSCSPGQNPFYVVLRFGLADSLDCSERGKRNLAVKLKKENPAHLVTLSDNENIIKKKKRISISRVRLLGEEKVEWEWGGHVLTFHSQCIWPWTTSAYHAETCWMSPLTICRPEIPLTLSRLLPSFYFTHFVKTLSTGEQYMLWYNHFTLILYLPSPSRAWPWAPLCVHTCLISLPHPDCPQLLPITSCVVTLTSLFIARSFPGFWGIVWRLFSSFPFSSSFICSFLLSTPLSLYQGCYTVRVQRGACGWMWVSALKRKEKIQKET